MTEKLKSFLELVDTKSEILAWIVLAFAFTAFFFGMEHWPVVALVAISVALHGYIQKVKVAQAELEFK